MPTQFTRILNRRLVVVGLIRKQYRHQFCRSVVVNIWNVYATDTEHPQLIVNLRHSHRYLPFKHYKEILKSSTFSTNEQTQDICVSL